MAVHHKKYDLICIGGGIMSATLALILKLIDEHIKILILEKLGDVALESSGVWNNAGTGHAGFCELNYTERNKEGAINISKAVEICTQFELSKQFWAYLIEKGLLEDPKTFIYPVPHYSWVTGEENVAFLTDRYQAMKKHVLFKEMEFSDDFEVLKKWLPLIMNQREPSEVMAATRMGLGTEVNFDQLTRSYFRILKEQFNTYVYTHHEVLGIDSSDGMEWLVEVKNLSAGKKEYYTASCIFMGAGGGTLPLLQTMKISEKNGYGGFPVSGRWLICNNPEVIKKHYAKVYSKAGAGAPPMSMPHLDTRYINGKEALLFGPFAGFSTKFLKNSSFFDLFKSINKSNLSAYWSVFWHNLPLVSYLIKEVRMSHRDRMAALRRFIKDADDKDWELKTAGQRVQVIKKDQQKGGILQFGTEVVHSKDGSITALLGASPGASTAVHIVLHVLQLGFSNSIKTTQWQDKLSEMIPFWHKNIEENEEEFKKLRIKCSELLKINSSIIILEKN